MNVLSHIDDFRQVLQDYRLADSAKAKLQAVKLVLLVGPTSTGKNTIINELVKSGKYHGIVSDTTRKPRVNDGILEQNGREYWFREEQDLLHDLQNGQFLEAAIIHNQQVSGISIRELESSAHEGKIAINEVEVVGANNIHAAAPQADFIFVVPPSFAIWMQRMQSRGELASEEIRRRLESACQEFEAALHHDYYQIVVNVDFVHAAAAVRRIVEDGAVDVAEQAEGKELIRQLLQQTQAYLTEK